MTSLDTDLDVKREDPAAMSEDYPLTGLFLKNRLRHALGAGEKDRLEALIFSTEDLADGTVVCKRGELCSHSTLLLDGFMLRVIHHQGQRHIVGIQVPGDFVDLHGFALRRLDHDLVSVGPTRVGYATHDALRETMAEAPHLTRILWFSTLLDAAIHREWILKMEQLNADGRLAHLFVEIWYRLHFVGRADPDGYDLPLTQVDLADMCGTTAIHMNRIMRQLRESKLLEFRRGRVTIPDREALQEFARFTPDYLYGDGELAMAEDY